MRDDDVLLVDIVEHARHVRAAVAGLTRERFDGDVLIRMGLTHLLQIIGEAARQLPEPARQRFPGVPWGKIVGMRHRLVHEYFRINFDLVWVTATRDAAQLLEALEPTIGPIIDQRMPEAE